MDDGLGLLDDGVSDESPHAVDSSESAAAEPATGAAHAGTADDDADLVTEARATALYLARIHLRMGSLALARAELESFAGSGTLDEVALLDLAEARWRTGDLAGAGEAADAAIGRGVDDPLAFVIAAEAVAALGRPARARGLASRAVSGLDGSLDALFAGMPRSTIWPPDPDPVPVPSGATAVLVSKKRAAHGRDEPQSGPASAAAAEAFAGGRAALARGDVGTAALRLGVAIRLEPAFAEGVLDALGERSSEPALALVAGDALRLLGREHEALAAFDVARGRLADPGRSGRTTRDPEVDPEAGTGAGRS